jgi:hypothetical protein
MSPDEKLFPGHARDHRANTADNCDGYIANSGWLTIPIIGRSVLEYWA